MKQTTTIIWKAEKKVNEKGNIGYLLLSTRVNGKQKLRSLGLPPIHKNYWLKKSNRVSDSFPETLGHNSESINKFIETKLRESQLAHHDFRYLPDEKKSLLEYWQQQIDLTLNIGTKTKYENVKTLLEKYIKEEFTAVDVKFKDITPAFIKGFINWLRVTNKNTKNTANYKVKNLQAIVNRAINEGIYHYTKNPFDSIEYQFDETMIKELLSLEELDRLINTQYVEVVRSSHRFGQLSERVLNDIRYQHQHTLEDYRNFWLFQLFGQGIRVSDLVTLRWNDFKIDENNKYEIRIVKRMIKTKGFVTIYINDKLIDILQPYVMKAYRKLFTISSSIVLETSEKVYKAKVEEFNKIKWIEKKKRPSPINAGVKRLMEIDIKEKDKWIEDIEALRRKHIKRVIDYLSQSEYKTQFVFGILNDSDFTDINENNDFGTMNKKQYNKFTGGRSYYNRLLKLVAIQAKIKKNLTTHLARHSYTTLMLELGENINLFDVMNSLGHKHLTTTQKYLQKFTNKKLDNLNNVLSQKLNAKWIVGKDGKPFNPLQKI
jgi:integrase